MDAAEANVSISNWELQFKGCLNAYTRKRMLDHNAARTRCGGVRIRVSRAGQGGAGRRRERGDARNVRVITGAERHETWNFRRFLGRAESRLRWPGARVYVIVAARPISCRPRSQTEGEDDPEDPVSGVEIGRLSIYATRRHPRASFFPTRGSAGDRCSSRVF